MGRVLRLRFSLRLLFIVITGIAVFLGTWLARAERQRIAVYELRNIELCEIGYDFNAPVGWQRLGDPLEPDGPPNWIVKTFGVNFVHGVVDVTIPTTHLDEALPHLQALPNLRAVYVYPYDADDDERAQQQLREAFEKVRRSLPGVSVEEAPSCPIETFVIPVVG